MSKIVVIAASALLLASANCAWASSSPDADPAKPAAAAATGTPMLPLERVASTPKGQLKNPYTDDNAAIVEEGKKFYMKAGCNGCHGGGGGGGMCPPLSNDTWVYGGDDDTLFRLISGGSDALQKNGYARKGRENIVGPMMQFSGIVKTDDDLWKLITFIRSNYRGGPSKKFGDQPK